MNPYRERMQQEAARLRAARAHVESTGGMKKAVLGGYVGLHREHGSWVIVRHADMPRHAALKRELAAVEGQAGGRRPGRRAPAGAGGP